MLPCPPPDFEPRPPRWKLPPGATDCHAHVYGPAARYALSDERSYDPPEALLSDYRRMLRTTGLQRAVLVQPSAYGTDNTAHLDALAEAGADFRMVAVVDETVTDGDLERMQTAGVRGIRINVINRGGVPLELLERLAARLAPLGWHIQLFVDAGTLPDIERRLEALAVPAVIDHMGHATAERGLDHPGFQSLLRLLRGGNCWVKLSGAYRLSREEVPYRDVLPYARALIEAGPERVVWGSDWPHPVFSAGLMPNDGDLVDILADWAPDERQRRKILVDNPARLYGFPTP